MHSPLQRQQQKSSWWQSSLIAGAFEVMMGVVLRATVILHQYKFEKFYFPDGWREALL